MNTLFAAWRTFQDSFLQYVSGALLLGLTLLAVLEVIRRYGFGVSFEWQQDAVTYGILSGIFLFFGITQTRKAHLRVTVLLLVLRERCGRWGIALATAFEIFGRVVAVALCTYLVWRGVEVVELMISQKRTTESLVFPLWPFFSIFLTGIAFLAISFLFQLWHDIQVLCGNEGLVHELESNEDDEYLL